VNKSARFWAQKKWVPSYIPAKKQQNLYIWPIISLIPLFGPRKSRNLGLGFSEAPPCASLLAFSLQVGGY